MKNGKILKTILLFAVAALGLTAAAGEAQNQEKLKEVDVFYHYMGTDGTESEIRPLKRKVPAAAPLRPAIEELLKEPTAAEQKRGYYSAGYGDLQLVSVKIKKKTARIDFRRTISDDYNPGDLQTLAFESAVKQTAMQFPAVKKVIVCVNGMKEFGIGLVIDAPEPCPKEK